MFAANTKQVHKKNPADEDYNGYVIFQRIKSGTKVEKEIRKRHEKIDTTLAEQNVLYAEITTNSGKNEMYKKFHLEEAKHPIFFLLDKHPTEYMKNDKALIVEWGKCENIEEMKNDLMTLVNFFSNEEVVKDILKGKDENKWEKLLDFVDKHGIIKTGLKIATSIL